MLALRPCLDQLNESLHFSKMARGLARTFTFLEVLPSVLTAPECWKTRFLGPAHKASESISVIS